jgi:hypothetical protein
MTALDLVWLTSIKEALPLKRALCGRDGFPVAISRPECEVVAPLSQPESPPTITYNVTHEAIFDQRQLHIHATGATADNPHRKTSRKSKSKAATEIAPHWLYPLDQSLAHGLVLNMHRVQGMTYDRTISVIDSHDRLLNSASLFYVLNSRARVDSAIHLDDKQAVARSIESHRGATPNALDLCPELASALAEGMQSKTDVDAQLDRSLIHAALEIAGLKSGTERSQAPESETKSPELKIHDPAPTKSYDFDMDM